MKLVIYKTDKGYKVRYNENSFMELGETNGNGWTLVSVQCLYKGCFIDKEDYIKIKEKKNKKYKKVNKFREIIRILFDF